MTTVAQILDAAGFLFGATPEAILTGKSARVTRMRFAVAYAAFHGGRSHGQIATAMRRDRSTISNAVIQATALRETDPVFRERTDKLVRLARRDAD